MTHTPLARAALICALLGAPMLGATSTASADPPALREVDSALVRADREAVRLLQILDSTRRSRNVAQIACVDRQLSQLNSFTRLLQLRRERLEDAIAVRDDGEMRRERRIVQRLADQLADIARAGLACVYPPAGQADRTVVEVTVSPDVRHHADLSPPPRRD